MKTARPGITGSTSRSSVRATPAPVDRKTTFDKLTNVHYSGTAHDEDQPSHLLVHTEVCTASAVPSTATRARGSVRRTSTRSSASRAAAAAADQRLQLRALQDVRHHGSVPGHHLGAAGGRRAVLNTTACSQLPTARRPASQDVSGKPALQGARRASARAGAAIAGLGYPLINALATLRWRVEGLQHYDAIVRTAGSRSWASGTAASCRPRSTSAAAASSSSPARTSTASGSPASSSASATAPRADHPPGGPQAREMTRCAPAPGGLHARRSRGPARAAQPGAVAGRRHRHPVLPFHLEASRPGRRAAGTARRCRSRSAPWPSRSESR